MKKARHRKQKTKKGKTKKKRAEPGYTIQNIDKAANYESKRNVYLTKLNNKKTLHP